ncbi:MAG: hypothetical protein J7K17_03000 [Candidatus Omnitrophica bacterium]|nr:hypothetical protein [Candidatus Omnitrophota bacterium]
MNNDIVIREKVNEQLLRFSDKLTEGLKRAKRSLSIKCYLGFKLLKI